MIYGPKADAVFWKSEQFHPDTDAASRPTLQRITMAISTFYDAIRYYAPSEHDMVFRRQEDKYRRAQQQMEYNPAQQAMLGQALVNTAPEPNPKDPLSFLSKADNKLLLTGEAP